MKLKCLFLLLFFLACQIFHEDNIAHEISNIILDTNSKLEHMEDYPYKEYYQTSEETYKRGGGDCEDFVIVCIEEIKKQLNIECYFIGLYTGHTALGYKNKNNQLIIYECTNKLSTKLNEKHQDKIYEIINYKNLEQIIKLRRYK